VLSKRWRLWASILTWSDLRFLIHNLTPASQQIARTWTFSSDRTIYSLSSFAQCQRLYFCTVLPLTFRDEAIFPVNAIIVHYLWRSSCWTVHSIRMRIDTEDLMGQPRLTDSRKTPLFENNISYISFAISSLPFIRNRALRHSSGKKRKQIIKISAP